MLPRLRKAELMIVQGDTSSALGAALAASAAQIPAAHVEAGLRSHDLVRPWPEEEFRRAIDAHAQFLFAPTELSAANLRREQVRGDIQVTGNTGIDALVALKLQESSVASRTDSDRPAILVTCHRRESWGAGLAGIAGALRTLVQGNFATVDLLLHPNPATSAYMRSLLWDAPEIRLHSPLGHAQTIAAMMAADAVLSDSGGMQEECAALGIPLLVLRERTERPEAIASGQMRMVGTDPGRIVAAVRKLRIQAARPAPELTYGDGQAAQRIAAMIEDWLTPRTAAVTLRVGRGAPPALAG